MSGGKVASQVMKMEPPKVGSVPSAKLRLPWNEFEVQCGHVGGVDPRFHPIWLRQWAHRPN